MKRSTTIWTVALLLLTVSVAPGQKVTYDYDHSADFTRYKTYMWMKEPETPKNPLMKPRIIDSINRQLALRGLRMVDSGADLALAVHVATEEKQTLHSFYTGYPGWGWAWGNTGTTMIDTYTYTEGSILADLFDVQTKQVVWRGYATKELSDKPEKVIEQAEKTIKKLFKEYPPRRDN